MDQQDELASFRSEFTFPKRPDGTDMVYFCGNSLGLQPKNLRKYVLQQLDKWDEQGVEGHFTGEMSCNIIIYEFRVIIYFALRTDTVDGY